MLQKILVVLLLLAAGPGIAQTYTYRPLDLDTSCYWLSGYSFYSDSKYCDGEKLSAVTGDTTISGQRFLKVSTYPTVYYPSSTMPLCQPFLFYPSVSYIREDTAARKVYDNHGNVLADFGRQPGDTVTLGAMSMTGGPSVQIKLVVDSVAIQYIVGLNRRVQWMHSLHIAPYGSFKTIEGIGANFNLPVAEYGEWGIPAYLLLCYNKGGQTAYRADTTITSCPKKSAYKLAVQEAPALSSAAFIVDDHQLRITNGALLPLDLQVYDMNGRRLLSRHVTSVARIALDLLPGNYVLKLTRQREVMAFRYYVR